MNLITCHIRGTVDELILPSQQDVFLRLGRKDLDCSATFDLDDEHIIHDPERGDFRVCTLGATFLDPGDDAQFAVREELLIPLPPKDESPHPVHDCCDKAHELSQHGWTLNDLAIADEIDARLVDEDSTRGEIIERYQDDLFKIIRDAYKNVEDEADAYIYSFTDQIIDYAIEKNFDLSALKKGIETGAAFKS